MFLVIVEHAFDNDEHLGVAAGVNRALRMAFDRLKADGHGDCPQFAAVMENNIISPYRTIVECSSAHGSTDGTQVVIERWAVLPEDP